MAILDWIKEIPLSAVYKERLVDSEKQITALEKENTALKQENSELKSRLEKLEKDRRALEKKVVNKSTESHGIHLDEAKEKILTLLSQHSDLTEEQISGHLSMSIQLAKFHLEELKKKSMVSDFYAMESPVYWSIDQAGRSYLFSHGLLA
ncbi:MAG: hypothetical protein ABL933_02405 [Methyloglobulus sp.]|nr:hypothetical protein [Methyloglobulus sp.]